jgi:hypothetical protein
MSYISNITRPAGDPKVLHTGPGSMATSDRLARALGWFSIGLGTVELLAPRRLAHALGLRGKADLLCAYGAREIGSGILSLSIDKEIGLWGRVAGDVLDLATLTPALRRDNPKRGNANLAMLMTVGVMMLDVAVARSVADRHARSQSPYRYSDRSGFPKGLEAARGAARSAQSA